MSVELKKGTTMELMMAAITEELGVVAPPGPVTTTSLGTNTSGKINHIGKSVLESVAPVENKDFLSSAIETLVSVLQLLEDNRLTLDSQVDELLSNDDYQSARNLRGAYKSLKLSVEDLLDAIEFVEYYLE
jgi:hypothetical protein